MQFRAPVKWVSEQLRIHAGIQVPGRRYYEMTDRHAACRLHSHLLFGRVFSHQGRMGSPVNRIKAVRKALDGRANSVYLEIGVKRGWAFRRVAAGEKFAVDPALKLSGRSRRQAAAKGSSHYFAMTSDDFFENEAEAALGRGVDVALIDGLHTYEQALRDVENTLRYLRDDGVIFLHDCNPALEIMGRPAPSYAEYLAQQSGPVRWGIWNGDVWKAIVHLRTRSDLRVAVLKCDFGVGVVRRGSPEARLPYSPDQVAAMTYADLAADRKGLLDLKPAAYLGELLPS